MSQTKSPEKSSDNAPVRGQSILTIAQKYEVLAYFAEGWSSKMIVDELKDKYGIEISVPGIAEYKRRKKYRKVIERLRVAYEKEIMKEPMASKRNRLKWLERAAAEAMTWRIDKINYTKGGRKLSTIYKRNPGIIAKIVQEARHEIEGDEQKGTDIQIQLITIIKDLNKEKKLDGPGEIKLNPRGSSRLDQFLAK